MTELEGIAVFNAGFSGHDHGPLLRRRTFDNEVRAGRAKDPRPWGIRPWLIPLVTVLLLIVVGQTIARLVQLHGQALPAAGATFSIAGDLVLLVVVWMCGRGPARRLGGWRPAFGISEPGAADLLPWVLGVAMVFVGGLVVGAVAAALSHGRAGAEAQNFQLDGARGVTLELIVAALVVIAPVAEELTFRGLLLRTFARRLKFWPSAILSTAIFAALHVYEVRTVTGALTLAAAVAVLGLTNCYLVRITGRLMPGVFVHATSNLIAVLILIHQSR